MPGARPRASSPMPTPDPLSALVALSNRIGQDPRLVQPGGGNTSVKLDDALLVKGSGTDLRTIGPDGFAHLSLAKLAPLAEAESMSDAEMMRFMAGCMLREGPAPSVETPLHSLLPHRVIVHTHDVATMSLTNVSDGVAERLVGELFEGDDRLCPLQPPRLPACPRGGRDGGSDPRARDRPHPGAPRPRRVGRRRRGGAAAAAVCRGEDRRIHRRQPARPPAPRRGPDARRRPRRSASVWRRSCCRRCAARSACPG